MKKAVLVISRPGDSHLPFVLSHLRRPTVVIDPLAVARKVELSFHMAARGNITISHDGQPLENICSVWLRKPTLRRHLQLPLAKEHQEYSQTALQTHGLMLYSLLNEAFWVSDYFAIQRANAKPYQLQLARQLGFRVPDTCFTADHATAQRFIDNHDSTIIKSSATIFPNLPDGTLTTFHAQRISKSSAPDMTNLFLAPAILQQAIEPEFDVRVTVVGQRVFAAAIYAHTSGQRPQVRDWRYGYYDGSLEIIEHTLPPDMVERCRAHVGRLGLAFGAIDLIYDKRDRYWFLENNPNGQWAFIEEATGQPIGACLAQVLDAASIG